MKSAPFNDTLSMPAANTQYAYTLPQNSHYILFKPRGLTSTLYMSYGPGNVPPGNGKYITINSGSSKELDDLSGNTSQTIYFSTDTPGEILEIESWQ